MPSSDECLEAKANVKQWAKTVLIRKGHTEISTNEILKWMPYDEQVKLAEEIQGPIYRGPYSPY